MIKKLNNYFFVAEDMENEESLNEGSLFYVATFGCLVVAGIMKLITL
ncbi:hypothetical protein M3649_03955 [Ureibacillus chungkukjangi]|nr:hypothetical protein [Ureibacillus chungkukjangi]MCM3387286.1 hypothetical protein [Ureibacillus chungkukjangi]